MIECHCRVDRFCCFPFSRPLRDANSFAVNQIKIRPIDHATNEIQRQRLDFIYNYFCFILVWVCISVCFTFDFSIFHVARTVQLYAQLFFIDRFRFIYSYLLLIICVFFLSCLHLVFLSFLITRDYLYYIQNDAKY